MNGECHAQGSGDDHRALRCAAYRCPPAHRPIAQALHQVGPDQTETEVEWKAQGGLACPEEQRTEGCRRQGCGRPGAMEASARSAELTSELQSLMRTSYAVFCLKKPIIFFPLHFITLPLY